MNIIGNIVTDVNIEDVIDSHTFKHIGQVINLTKKQLWNCRKYEWYVKVKSFVVFSFK